MRSFFFYNSYLIILAALAAPLFTRAQSDTLIATQGESDAYITLAWTIAPSCQSGPNREPAYLQILNAGSGEVVYSELIETLEADPDTTRGTYDHWVGPGKTIDYRMELYAYGPGSPLCLPPTEASGSTLPFQTPVVEASDGAFPERIEVNVFLHPLSHLASFLEIYRDDQLIAILDSARWAGTNQATFLDSYRFADAKSIQNGKEYQYCVKVRNRYFNQTYGKVCDAGSTYPISFSASDEMYLDEVLMNWNALSSLDDYVDQLKIRRDGQDLTVLPQETVTFTDTRPTYGKAHLYELILIKDDANLIAIPDTGSVKANGRIAGRVTTKTGDYGLPGASIYYESRMEGRNYQDSTFTDQTGRYAFEEIYYAESAVFKITAAKTGHSFANNPRNITLSRTQPEAPAVDFTSNQNYTRLTDELPQIDGLLAEAKPEDNSVRLSWSYEKAATDTVFVQILRSGRLLDLWMDIQPTSAVDTTFTDITGIPGTAYTYTVRVYRLENGSIVVSEASSTVTYPVVHPVIDDIIAAQTDTGIVRLSWSYPATENLTGFYLYRDEEPIKTVDPAGPMTYVDQGGAPAGIHTYAISAFLERGGKIYESEWREETVDYPPLPVPTGLDVQPDIDHVVISWDNSSSTFYNFDGFLLYRKKGETEALIATIDKGFPTEFIDLTGLPDSSYAYSVVSYAANRLGQRYESERPAPVVATYPSVTAPSNLSAETGSVINEVSLTWEHASDYNDGFVLFRNDVEIATLPAMNPGWCKDHLNRKIETNSRNVLYELAAFVRKNGVAFYSEKAPANYLAPATPNIPAYPPLPAAFRASEQYPDHVLLTWEYPPYLLPQFRIFRDGEPLAEIDAHRRSFADETAVPGTTYLYSLQAVKGDSLSGSVYDEGALLSGKRLYGRVFGGGEDSGVGGARITAHSLAGDPLRYQTTTDAAGYYHIDALPFTEGRPYEVRAEAVNHQLEDPVRTITLVQDINGYEENFYSTKQLPTPDKNAIAMPTGLVAAPDERNISVEVRWSAGSSNYTGFEVYRSLTLLATVAKGEPLRMVDESGVSNIDYSYRVRAYWDTEDRGRLFSDYAGVLVSFPSVPAPAGLYVLPNLDFDRVELSWSHPTGEVDYFRITRSLGKSVSGGDPVLADIPVDSAWQFWDATGLPGNLYSYAVYAVAERGKTTFVSAPAYKRGVSFPVVATVDAFNAIPIDNGVQLTWDRRDKTIEGFKLFRGEELIATLDGSSYEYRDYGGVPVSTYTYGIEAYYTATDGDEKESNRWEEEGVLYPQLTAVQPQGFILTDSAGAKVVRWTYPHVDGYDGFELFLARDTIELPIVSDVEQQFLDLTGLPGESYPYGIRVYKKVSGGRYYSNMTRKIEIYAPLPAPRNLTASDGEYYNYVLLEWDYDSDLNDGFVVYRDETAIDTVWEKGARRYMDLFNQFPPIGKDSYTYGVSAFRVDDDQIFVSGVAKDDGWAKWNLTLNQFKCAGYYPYMNNVSISKGKAAIRALNNGIDIYEKSDDGEWIWDRNFLAGLPVGFGAIPPDYSAPSLAGEYLLVNSRFPGYPRPTMISLVEFGGTTSSSILSVGGDIAWVDKSDINDHAEFILRVRYNPSQDYDPEKEKEKILLSKFSTTTNIETPKEIYSYTPTTGLIDPATGVSISNELTAARVIENNKPMIRTYYKETGQWKQSTLDVYSPPGGSSNFGRALAIDGDYMAVGDENRDKGLAYMLKFNWNTKKWDFNSRDVLSADDPRAEAFGWSLALDGNRLAVGAPETDNNQGAVYIFERDGEEWKQIRKITEPNPRAGHKFGLTLDLSEDNLVVAGQDLVSFFDLDRPDAPASVTASDGAYAGYVKVSWKHDANLGPTEAYHIYRSALADDAPERIAEVLPHTSQYSDLQAVPGRRYVYSVAAVGENGEESMRIADVGWRRANGKIRGQVLTQQSGSGVPNIELMLTSTGLVDGSRVRRSTVSAPDGSFEFAQVPYGDGAAFTVRAFASGHAFAQAEQRAELNEDEQQVFVQFMDETAYVLRGRLYPLGSDCGIDSVEVKLSTYSGGSTEGIPEIVKSGHDGYFSFNVDPFQADLDSVRLEISNLAIKGKAPDQDTLHYQFSPASFTIDKQQINTTFAASQVFSIEIIDTLAYTVPVAVEDACGNPLGTDKYLIEVKSKDGCFSKTAKTDSNGHAGFRLPPMEYLVTVRDVDKLTAKNKPIIDYLKYRPETLHLAAHHLDPATTGQPPDKLSIVYHRQPVISIAGGLKRYLCDDPQLPAVIVQHDSVYLQLAVAEGIGNDFCPVGEGFLVIKNPAAANAPPDTVIVYDSENEAFPTYAFKVGNPVIISPHIHYLIAEYHTASDGYLAELIQPIIVEGTKPLPGSDVIISVDTSEEGQVKLPLFILRDPPGDDSYSYIKKGTTFEKSLNITDLHEETGGITFDSKFIGGFLTSIGKSFRSEAKFGGSQGKTANLKISAEVLEQISTSNLSTISQDGEYIIGENADVIVGAGLASQYGIAVQVRVNDDCTIEKRTTIGLTGAHIKSQWIYNVNHIKNILIKGYEKQLEDLRQGRLEIAGQDTTEARRYLTNLKRNWEAVLNYHREETLPHYNLCNPDAWPVIPEPYRSRLAEWKKEGFCEEIGSYEKASTKNGLEKDTFILKDFEWTTVLRDKYNKLQEFVRDHEDNYLQYPIYSFEEDRLNDVKIDERYNSLYGPDAENITFSGNTIYSKEVSVSESKSRGFTNSWTANLNEFLGLDFSTSKTILWGTAGPGFFWGLEDKVIENNIQLGFSFSYNFKFEKFVDTTQTVKETVGFVLGDDEDGDQYSVTVIRGIDPSHTPYFDLLGGRSACPPYEGTILREKPLLSFEWPNGVGVNSRQYNVPSDGSATFPLALKNENPFNEGRWFYVYLDPASNPYGARVYLDGRLLTEELYLVPANEPLYTTLQIERGAGAFYQYEDLRLIIRSYCSDIRANNALDRDSIHFSVYFDHPCSEVAIAEPGNNWVVKQRNPLDSTSREQLLLRITDYDLTNEQLDSLRIQYRRVGTAVSDGDAGWKTDAILTLDSLIRYYDEYRLVYDQPQYIYAWDITGRPEILDGEYELRVVADCGAGGRIFSNVIRGLVDRTYVELFGFPEPADGVLSPGESIMVTFNKYLNCAAKDQFAINLTTKETGESVSFTCTCSGKQLELKVDYHTRNAFDGQILTARVGSVLDRSGNNLKDPIVWSFRVIQNPLYWNPGELTFEIYQDEEFNFTADLYNSYSNGFPYTLIWNAPWLEPLLPSDQIAPSRDAGKHEVNFKISTQDLEIGTAYHTAVKAEPDEPIVGGAGSFTPYLNVTVHVIARPPDWAIDPAGFPDNMFVIANYQFSDEQLSSQDTMDIISAWMGNELRGLGRLRQIREGDYAAYLTVYGDADTDAGRPLSFRVWQAATGDEYDARPQYGEEIQFQARGRWGSSSLPGLLEIDRDYDLARYIPLGQEWTWFSLNSMEDDQSADHILREIQAHDGDLIRNRDHAAAYLAGQWIPLGNSGLEEMKTSDGYAIFLQQADTLRVTGTEAIALPVNLSAGWHFLGYPRTLPQKLTAAFFQGVHPDTALIFTSRSELDGGQDQFATFENGNWDDIGFELKPNRAYQLYLSQAAGWNFGAGEKEGREEAGKAYPKDLLVTTADPQDLDTWQVDPAAFRHSMILTAVIDVNGMPAMQPGDRVAAFAGQSCRGVGETFYVESLDALRLAFFIYGQAGEELHFWHYDALSDQVLDITNTAEFVADQRLGDLLNPYPLHSTRLSLRFEKRDLYCTEDMAAYAGVIVSGGTPPYQYQWSNGAKTRTIGSLAPGLYRLTVTDAQGVAQTGEATILNLQQPIEAPLLTVIPGDTVCGGSDLVMFGQIDQDKASILWFDEEGKLLSRGDWLEMPEMQTSQRIVAVADLYGCRSEEVARDIVVRKPNTGFTVTPGAEIAQGALVQFHPDTLNEAYDYYWQFGDNGWSTLPEPYYFYNLMGKFDVSLRISDENGCYGTEVKNDYIMVGGSTSPKSMEFRAESLIGAGALEAVAFPNPFEDEIILVIKAPEPDRYRFYLTDLLGRRYLFREISLEAGTQQMILPTGQLGLASGVYLLYCESGESNHIFKLMKSETR